MQLIQPIFGSSLLNPVQGEFSTPKMLGGVFGYWINDKLLMQLSGSVGAAVILGIIYLISFVLLFDIKPVDLIRAGWVAAMDWYNAREAEKYATADPVERLEHQKRMLEKKHKELQKKLAKEGLLVDEDVEHLANRPAPKIVDTTITKKRREREMVEENDDTPIIAPRRAAPRAKKEPIILPAYENYVFAFDGFAFVECGGEEFGERRGFAHAAAGVDQYAGAVWY